MKVYHRSSDVSIVSGCLTVVHTTSNMNDPIKWERVPVTGTDLDVETYRSQVDGKGWIVLIKGTLDDRFAVAFVPDENGMWGGRVGE